MATLIPPMTHPLSASWDQPSQDSIDLDDTNARMTRLTYRQLKNYEWSYPTGVYEGKMWRSNDRLCWYQVIEGTDKCTIETRKIVLIDDTEKLDKIVLIGSVYTLEPITIEEFDKQFQAFLDAKDWSFDGHYSKSNQPK